MKRQYHRFCLNPQVEQAVLCAEDKKKLSSLSVQDLVQLKAELYGVYNLSNEEFIAQLNAPEQRAIPVSSELNPDEKRIVRALLCLDIHARKLMLKIAHDFHNRKPSVSKKDVHDLAFVFRHNGKDFKPYPEIKIMNAEVAWYHHQKLIALKKSVWRRFLAKRFDKALTSAKSVLDNCVSGLGYWLDDKSSPLISHPSSSKADAPIVHRLERTH